MRRPMGVLRRDAVFAGIAAKRLTVDPHGADQAGFASVEARLGDGVRFADPREV